MQFYILRPWKNELFGYKYSYAEIVDPSYRGKPSDRAVCQACGEGIGGRPWLPPHRVKLSKAKFPDLLWGAGFGLIVSARFLACYDSANLSGITRVDPPIEVVRIGRKPLDQADPKPPVFHHVWYELTGADLDDEASEARRPAGLCPVCRRSIDAVARVVIRSGSWTGVDIFEASGLPGSRLVTERFRQMVEDNGLTNAQFVPASEYHFDFRNYPSGR